MPTSEHTINDAIAALLRGTRYAWRAANVLQSETTQQLSEGAGLRPDIVIREPFTAPIVIESELQPAQSVEADALERIGKTLHGEQIYSVLALRLPERLRASSGQALRETIAAADDLEFALFTGRKGRAASRMPASGWLTGGLRELSLLIQSAAIPPPLVDETVALFEVGVNRAAEHLDALARVQPGAVAAIAEELHQQDSLQTRRMAMTILVNAFMFHEHLAGGSGDLEHVQTLAKLQQEQDGLYQGDILREWQKILAVNYWPIFDISTRILSAIPAPHSRELLEQLARTASRLVANNLMRSQDLTGTIFQRLIADRKFLAAFYTKPASAALLAALALSEQTLLDDEAWGRGEAVAALRIGDFACGTGTLLAAAYQRISQLHELRGGDAAAIHPQMMARALVGCDILPAAAHLSASTLAGAQPTVRYDESAIFTMPYGIQADGAVKLGSIELLRDLALLEAQNITAKAIEATQLAEVDDIWRFAPHGSFDMVIMNPPFTRDTNHEGARAEVSHPKYASFGAGRAVQKIMAAEAKSLTKGTVTNGHAGEASTFFAIADRKLKQGGMLALVMPVTFLTGSSWEKCRQRLRQAYTHISLFSIAGYDSAPLSFSADTGMGECLIVAQKSEQASQRASFVVLNEAPQSSYFSQRIARQIRSYEQTGTLRRLEDGPSGGSPLRIGEHIIGRALDAPLPAAGSWKLARIADLPLAQSAYQLASRGRVWLPTQVRAAARELPMATVSAVGELGPYHLQVSRKTGSGARRPFELLRLDSLPDGTVPTYPILWAHDAKRERRMSFEADHDGIPYRANASESQDEVDSEVERIFRSASHCHFNRDFRFNSQSTSMQYTERKTIGGSAWTSISLASALHEKVLVLWANSLLGMLMYWWQASKQQRGRGRITKTSLSLLPVLDVSILSSDKLRGGGQLFDELKQLPLKPLHELDQDENRKLLDRRFYGEILGFPAALLDDGGALDILRHKLCREPSIRGSKR